MKVFHRGGNILELFLRLINCLILHHYPLLSQSIKKMKESVDFVKIKDYAVININNMIPVPNRQLIELNINDEKDPHYKFLLQAESREINRQKNRIRKNAEIVYNHKKRNGNLTPLAKRTNNFEMLEKLSRDFL